MFQPRSLAAIIGLSLALAPAAGLCAKVAAPVALATAEGPGANVGTITLEDGPGGAMITVDLHGLPPGLHGFHIHENGACGPSSTPSSAGAPVAAGAAGGHFDPARTAMHMGPTGNGHLGDLPYLTVAADGVDRESLTAPRIRDVATLRGRALVIHAGGDNYADQPKPLGGGGARIACGVIH